MRAKRQAGVTLLEMLIVVAVIALVAGLTYPSVVAGLEGLKMRSATDSVAALMAEGVRRVERAEQPFELIILRNEGKLELRSADNTFTRTVKLEQGISILRVFPEVPGGAEAVRAVVFEPGSVAPRLGVELLSQRGARRIVRLDPLTAIPVVETPADGVHTAEER